MNQIAEPMVDPVVEEVLGRYAPEPASLISVLEDLQEGLHYLPREALDRVACALGVPRAQIYHVATFYRAFSLRPRGRHTVCVCRGTACHVQGAAKIADMLRAELKVSEGETTEDGQFTVESVRCLGCCSLAPVVMVDREVLGQVSRKALQDVIERYRDEDAEN